MRKIGYTVILAALAAAGCSKRTAVPAQAADTAAAPAVTAGTAVTGTPRPPTPAELATTSPALAVEELDNQIEGAEQLVGRAPQRAGALCDLYLTRAHHLGRLADYDRALVAAQELVRAAPAQPDSWLTHAHVMTALHRFAEARADLARAAEHGAPATSLEGSLATLAEATGDPETALPIRQRAAIVHPATMLIAAEAAVLGDLGRHEEAARRFADALDAYRDVSPFVVAWLFFQEGLMWQRAGMQGHARVLFEAALVRLPNYAPVIAHLAELEATRGDPARAVRLLEPLVQASDDPEYAGQLAAVHLAAGRTAAAEPLIARARVGYEALLARHPAAFSDHAARFYLGPGHDFARAAQLAGANLALRQTADAYTLALETSAAAGDGAGACRLAEPALTLARVPVHLRILAAQALRECGQLERATAVLAAIRQGTRPH